MLSDTYGGSETVTTITGYSRQHATLLKTGYRAEGTVTFVDKRKGRPKELLTKKQRETVIETVKTKTPNDVGYSYEYWTTTILGEWIKKEFNVEYRSRTSLYLVFKKASFSYHRPGTVYKERDEKEVAKWKKYAKKRLKELREEKDTVVLAGDEMILTTATTIQKVWIKKGEYPKIEISTGGRKRRNVYGFLDLKTGKEHAYKTELQNMHVTAEILQKVRGKYKGKKIVIFWDNAGWHKGSVAQEFVKHDGDIHIEWLPKYAPDLNPQENVWKKGRSIVTHNRYIEDIDEATDELVEFFKKTKFSYSMVGERLTS